MAIDFDKIDRSVDLKGLQADVEDAKKNGGDANSYNASNSIGVSFGFCI